MLGHMDILMIEYPKYYWHVAFGHKRLCYERATAGTFILNLLYRWTQQRNIEKFEKIRKNPRKPPEKSVKNGNIFETEEYVSTLLQLQEKSGKNPGKSGIRIKKSGQKTGNMF